MQNNKMAIFPLTKLSAAHVLGLMISDVTMVMVGILGQALLVSQQPQDDQQLVLLKARQSYQQKNSS